MTIIAALRSLHVAMKFLSNSDIEECGGRPPVLPSLTLTDGSLFSLAMDFYSITVLCSDCVPFYLASPFKVSLCTACAIRPNQTPHFTCPSASRSVLASSVVATRSFQEVKAVRKCIISASGSRPRPYSTLSPPSPPAVAG